MVSQKGLECCATVVPTTGAVLPVTSLAAGPKAFSDAAYKPAQAGDIYGGVRHLPAALMRKISVSIQQFPTRSSRLLKRKPK